MPVEGERPTELVVNPQNYQSVSPYELLKAAAQGYISIDHRVLHAILDRPDEAIPDLVRFAAEERQEDRLDLEEDLVAMFRHLRTPEAVPFFVECLRQNPHDAADELTEAFAEIGAPALYLLLALYEELEEEESGEVAFVLAALRVRDERVLKVLLERLEFDASDGAFLLGLYGDPAAKPALEKLLAELDSGDQSAADLRRELEYALEHFSAPTDDSFTEPFDIWSIYPEKAEPVLDILPESERLEFLKSDVEEYRCAAASSFRNELSSKTKRVLFEVASNDSSAEVRGRAWEALSGETEDRAVKTAMMSRLKDEAAPLAERCGALVGLAAEFDDAVVRGKMIEFYNKPGARAKALEAMWKSLDRSFAKYFPAHLEDEDIDIKRQAIWGSGYLCIGSQAAELRKLFEDDEFRADALFAYALSVPAEVSRSRMKSLFRKIEEVAGGLTHGEAQLVQTALDERLAFHGLDPVFNEEAGEEQPDTPKGKSQVGRNEPCPCGSGKKYKKCCGSPTA